MSFFNINFKNKNNAGAIGIIGGADGPTDIFIAEKKDQEEFLSYAAEKITPCERTFKELEQYLIEKYQGVPHTLLPHELKSLKVNVILNHFSHVIDRPAPLGENPTKKEIKAYVEQDTSVFQAREYPAEKLGLEMKAYKLKSVPSINKDRMGREHGRQFAMKNASYTEDDVIVELEMKSEYLSISNGSSELMNDLVLYRGVSEKDIKEKSIRFISYAHVLRNIGKI